MSLYAFYTKCPNTNYWFTFGYSSETDKFLQSMNTVSDKDIICFMQFECCADIAGEFLDDLSVFGISTNGWYNTNAGLVERKMKEARQKFDDNANPLFYAFYCPKLEMFKFGYESYIKDLYKIICNEFPFSVIMWQKTECSAMEYNNFIESIKEKFKPELNDWYHITRHQVKPHLNKMTDGDYLPQLVRCNATFVVFN